jgi:hypothetical protein
MYPAECNRDVPSPIGCIVAVHIHNGPKTKVVVLHRHAPRRCCRSFFGFYLLSLHIKQRGQSDEGGLAPPGVKVTTEARGHLPAQPRLVPVWFLLSSRLWRAPIMLGTLLVLTCLQGFGPIRLLLG